MQQRLQSALEADRRLHEQMQAEEKLERQISSRHSNDHPELISQDHFVQGDLILMPEQQQFISVDE
jgi:hypothetical protein